MALIKCPECQKDMSDTLQACPHCGFIVMKKKPAPVAEKPLSEDMVKCTKCEKPYYKGAGKCPYCRELNPNQQPFLSESKKKIATFSKLLNTHKVNIGIGVIILVIVISLTVFVSSYSTYHPTKRAAAEYDDALNSKIHLIYTFISSGKFSLAIDDIKRIKDKELSIKDDKYFRLNSVDMAVSENNYFRINGISDENDQKYFAGTYNSRIKSLDALNAQLDSAITSLNNDREYDKTIVTDSTIQNGYPVAVEIRKQEKIAEKQAKLREQYKDTVKKMFKDYLHSCGLYPYELKDKMVDKWGLRMLSSQSIRNDYGLNVRYIFGGDYNYKGMNFYVRCEIESTTSDGGYTYIVNVD